MLTQTLDTTVTYATILSLVAPLFMPLQIAKAQDNVQEKVASLIDNGGGVEQRDNICNKTEQVGVLPAQTYRIRSGGKYVYNQMPQIEQDEILRVARNFPGMWKINRRNIGRYDVRGYIRDTIMPDLIEVKKAVDGAIENGRYTNDEDPRYVGKKTGWRKGQKSKGMLLDSMKAFQGHIDAAVGYYCENESLTSFLSAFNVMVNAAPRTAPTAMKDGLLGDGVIRDIFSRRLKGGRFAPVGKPIFNWRNCSHSSLSGTEGCAQVATLKRKRTQQDQAVREAALIRRAKAESRRLRKRSVQRRYRPSCDDFQRFINGGRCP